MNCSLKMCAKIKRVKVLRYKLYVQFNAYKLQIFMFKLVLANLLKVVGKKIKEFFNSIFIYLIPDYSLK